MVSDLKCRGVISARCTRAVRGTDLSRCRWTNSAYF